MKIVKLISDLKQLESIYGNIEVMFDSDENDSMRSIDGLEYRMAEEDEFPESWNMPEGFEFIQIY